MGYGQVNNAGLTYFTLPGLGKSGVTSQTADANTGLTGYTLPATGGVDAYNPNIMAEIGNALTVTDINQVPGVDQSTKNLVNSLNNTMGPAGGSVKWAQDLKNQYDARIAAGGSPSGTAAPAAAAPATTDPPQTAVPQTAAPQTGTAQPAAVGADPNTAEALKEYYANHPQAAPAAAAPAQAPTATAAPAAAPASHADGTGFTAGLKNGVNKGVVTGLASTVGDGLSSDYHVVKGVLTLDGNEIDKGVSQRAKAWGDAIGTVGGVFKHAWNLVW